MSNDDLCPECLRGFPLISEEGMAVLLAAERRATVERIRVAAISAGYGHADAHADLHAILDAEAAR